MKLAWLLLLGVGPGPIRETTGPVAQAEYATPAELRQALDSLLEAPPLSDAEVGVYVVRLDDRREIYSRNADQLFVPASNVKLITTAAALHRLGPNYRFRTEVYGTMDPAGDIQEDLYLKGYGDPSLVPERVWYLATRLYFLGVRQVLGDIVVDDSYFAGPRLAAGWETDKASFAYLAPSGALSVGFNAIQVHVAPGARVGAPASVVLDPLCEYASVQGTIRTVARRRPYLAIDVVPRGARSVVRVSGRVRVDDPPRSMWRRIDNPPIFAGEVIRAILNQVGIATRGQVREGQVPDGAEKLLTLHSRRLTNLVSTINKNSNNFMAAQTARTLGAEVLGPPGTWEKGYAAIEEFLADEVGIPKGAYALGNASGLHDVNNLSPRQIVRLLEHMHDRPRLWPDFLASLAVAGGAGTLADRMLQTDAELLLRAKTGTLAHVSALSGYVQAQSGEKMAFSLMVNGYRTRASAVVAVQDEVGALLAAVRFARQGDEGDVHSAVPNARTAAQ